jgi:hypothetical protein
MTLPWGTSPEAMTREDLEEYGAWLARLAARDAHLCAVRGRDENCHKFAGVRCGIVGRELQRARETWREKNRRGWR